MKHPLPQVGAPDPELNTSPIDESALDEKAGARDLELEEAVCHFNSAKFPLGTYVQSGDEVLKCTGRGVATLPQGATVQDAAALMRERRVGDIVIGKTDSRIPVGIRGVRRAPILDRDGRLSGMVSVDDVLLLFAAELAELSELIRRGQLREARRTEVTFNDEFAA